MTTNEITDILHHVDYALEALRDGATDDAKGALATLRRKVAAKALKPQNEQEKTQWTADDLQDIADAVNGTLRAYSGRGMDGQECAAIACEDDTECIRLARNAGITGDRVDTLGRRYIVYWPQIAAPKE